MLFIRSFAFALGLGGSLFALHAMTPAAPLRVNCICSASSSVDNDPAGYPGCLNSIEIVVTVNSTGYCHNEFCPNPTAPCSFTVEITLVTKNGQYCSDWAIFRRNTWIAGGSGSWTGTAGASPDVGVVCGSNTYLSVEVDGQSNVAEIFLYCNNC